MAVRPLRFLTAASFVLAMPVWPVCAENRGEYGRAEVEVDRSVLQDLQGYQPPPMFQNGGAEKDPVAAPAIPPPEKVILTAPKTEDLLDHPVENHKVLTLQGSMVRDDPPSDGLPVPGEGRGKKLSSSSTLPPVPPHKPRADKSVAAVKAPVSSAFDVPSEDKPDDGQGPLLPLPPPGTMAKQGEFEKKAPAEETAVVVPARKPKDADRVMDLSSSKEVSADKSKETPPTQSNHYRPSTAKTMPAVPPVKVEANPIPNMANMPPISPDDKQRPTAGEIMMDDALTRHMVKNDKDVKEVLGIQEDGPPAEDAPMDQFSIAFKAEEIELKQDDRKLLDRTVIKRLSDDTKHRILIRSYASRSDGTESSARRTSLSRALVVRSYLLTKGIQPTRIDVRALSDQTQEKPLDRIDMTLIAPNS